MVQNILDYLENRRRSENTENASAVPWRQCFLRMRRCRF